MGCIVVYNFEDKFIRVLLDELYFLNGIVFLKLEDYFINCEIIVVRCMKFFFRGEKEGIIKMFIENLFGYLDNIYCNLKNGRFYIGILGNRNGLIDFVVRMFVVK